MCDVFTFYNIGTTGRMGITTREVYISIVKKRRELLHRVILQGFGKRQGFRAQVFQYPTVGQIAELCPLALKEEHHKNTAYSKAKKEKKKAPE